MKNNTPFNRRESILRRRWSFHFKYYISISLSLSGWELSFVLNSSIQKLNVTTVVAGSRTNGVQRVHYEWVSERHNNNKVNKASASVCVLYGHSVCYVCRQQVWLNENNKFIFIYLVKCVNAHLLASSRVSVYNYWEWLIEFEINNNQRTQKIRRKNHHHHQRDQRQQRQYWYNEHGDCRRRIANGWCQQMNGFQARRFVREFSIRANCRWWPLTTAPMSILPNERGFDVCACVWCLFENMKISCLMWLTMQTSPDVEVDDGVISTFDNVSVIRQLLRAGFGLLLLLLLVGRAFV